MALRTDRGTGTLGRLLTRLHALALDSLDMETPLVRPGKVHDTATTPRVVALFPNAAQGNMVIQLLGQLDIRMDRLGVLTPDQLERGQGMLLSIPCGDEPTARRVEDLCRRQGAQVHRQHA